MTIFTKSDKKESDVPSPEVVTEYKLLVENDKLSAVPPAPAPVKLPPPRVTVVPRRHPYIRLCVTLLTLILLVVLVFISITLYQHWHNTSVMYRGRCGVRYREEERMITQMLPMSGEFEQQVTIEDTQHETLEVPDISDMRRATVLHDFNQNMTAIIDRELQYCFLMPLDRTLVMPPRDFWDLLIKVTSGYYVPDVNIIRENYRALTPPIHDVSKYGPNIWRECRSFDTYRLVREDEPIAMSKRSAPFCGFVGKSWCLGDGGTNKMLCINVNRCL